MRRTRRYVEAVQGENIDLYLPKQEKAKPTIPHREPMGAPALVVETSEVALKVKIIGGSFHIEEDTEAQIFIEFVRSCGGS